MNKLVRTASMAMALGTAWAGAAAVLPLPGITAPARAASKLGDLSSYRAIVVDTTALVDKGDLVGEGQDQGPGNVLGRGRAVLEAARRRGVARRRQVH